MVAEDVRGGCGSQVRNIIADGQRTGADRTASEGTHDASPLVKYAHVGTGTDGEAACIHIDTATEEAPTAAELHQTVAVQGQAGVGIV